MMLTPADFPGRATPKPFGVVLGGTGAGADVTDPGAPVVGLSVPDARHHLVAQGITGAGKTTWLVNYALAEIMAGRGVAVLDVQGDLIRHILDRLPTWAGDRLVLIDPAEETAPPAYNVLDPFADADLSALSGHAVEAAREWAAEHVAGVFSQLFSRSWGPRMDDLMHGACLTLARRPGSTLADVPTLLTRDRWRRDVLSAHGEPPGLEGLWDGYAALGPAGQAAVAAPLLARLRAVLSRRFARELLGVPASTVNLTDVLDGGILLARLPKGEIGGDTARLIGGLLLSGLWAHTTRRAKLAPDDRRDATVIVDEAQNFLHLPIGMDEVFAESRGYRVSWVVAHQHLAQLPPEIRDAIAANARTKVLFAVSPDDARPLARHVAPWFDEHDLSARAAHTMTVRTVHRGHTVAPFTVAALPLPPPIPGRADHLRAAARARTGLDHDTRAALMEAQEFADLTGPPPEPPPGD